VTSHFTMKTGKPDPYRGQQTVLLSRRRSYQVGGRYSHSLSSRLSDGMIR
jgi:hypothetical protein